MIAARRDEAQRSIVVQVKEPKSYHHLFHYCSQFGAIKSAFHFGLLRKTNHIVIEYDEIAATKDAIRSIQKDPCLDDTGPIVKERFVYFGNNIKAKRIAIKEAPSVPLQQFPIAIDHVALDEKLRNANSVCEQIQLLYDNTRINELAIRLRFLACQQIEDILSRIYENARGLPFGSSVNGFGRLGSDVDLVFDFQTNAEHQSRLFAHPQGKFSETREMIQFQISFIGQIMDDMLAGVGSVHPILRARVPIVKCKHNFFDLAIDVSVTNM